VTGRILIADDQDTWLNLLKSELERDSAYQVCGQAVDGVQALAKALELRPDLVILDLTMPNMNGLEAAREISTRLPCVPILMYTLTDAVGLIVEASKVGIQAVVQKQQGIAPLLAAIQTALAKSNKNSIPELPVEALANAAALGDGCVPSPGDPVSSTGTDPAKSC
jgi:DNA-binding NarL/FixJ family response regulator